MKCDELKAETIVPQGCTLTLQMYPKGEVDAAIAELKDENERLVKCCKEYDSRQRIDERIKFNGAQQLRSTKRALWLARAERARDKAFEYHFKNNVEMCAKWDNVHLMLMAKAEEYK